MRAAVRSRHESLGICAPTGDVGGQSYGAPSPIYRPPHSFPRTPDDGEGGGGSGDGVLVDLYALVLNQAPPHPPAARWGWRAPGADVVVGAVVGLLPSPLPPHRRNVVRTRLIPS